MSSSSARKKAQEATAASLHLKELPENFEPSAEEAKLQQMYAAIKAFEKEAIRVKEKKAREKIFDNATSIGVSQNADDTNEDQDQQQQETEETPTADVKGPTSTTKKTAKRPGARKKRDPLSQIQQDGFEDEDDGGGDIEDGGDKAQREAAKLEALRLKVEQMKNAKKDEAEIEEENKRKEALATNDDTILTGGPALKKARKDLEAAPGQSILDGLVPAQTPPHEFSKNLNIFDGKGKVIFPTFADENAWVPPQDVSSPNDGAFLAELPDFDINKASNGQGNNTIAIKFMAPEDSKRFSINIAAPGQKDMESILFHFNPRSRGKKSGGMLVVNDKQSGVWGRAVQLPLSQVPLMFGQESVTLIIQINGDGFDVFIEGEHCVRLEHRTELPPKSCSLWLQFPSSDDSLKPENWTVYKAWWGNKESMIDEDTLSRVPGYKAFDAVHPRKLFLSGLPKIRTDREAEIRRAELDRQFMKYAGDRGVTTIVPLHSSYAFVEFETERGADLALRELSGALPYKINRARRSKHEALTEKREVEALAAEGKTKSSGDW
mmetsp:Transcript_57723/g.140979  ORF Transcript_57723/g.140979 Transcript_57723/m.140979 type:complete len:550 (-) Transcript_57723:65-1714(-)